MSLFAGDSNSDKDESDVDVDDSSTHQELSEEFMEFPEVLVPLGNDPLNDQNPAFHVAVAFPVSPDSESLPNAVRLRAKPDFPLHPKSRQLFLLFLCFIFATVFGMTYRMHVPTWHEDDQVNERVTLIQQRLAEAVGEHRVFQLDKEDPYARAQEWILCDDPLQLQEDSIHLVQRFLMAVLYFQFHQEGEFRWCNAAASGDSDPVCSYGGQFADSNVRMQNAPKLAHKWLSIHHECTWGGISCVESVETSSWEVSELDLAGMGIKSVLPSEVLLHLPWLQKINFTRNQFYGTLPPEWSRLVFMKEVTLSSNDLQGKIPAEWVGSSMAGSLRHFDVCSNKLSGSLPISFFASMPNVEVLNLQRNAFTGTIPKALFQLKKLLLLSLYDNLLTGTIPAEIGEWKSPLIHISMFKLDLEGTIPNTISQLPNLRVLDLSSTNIEGLIPEAFYDIPRLQKLDVSNTRLTGTLSSSVGKLSDLVHLDVSHTSLSGSLPSSEISSLKKLEILRINDNDLTGEITEEICDMRGPLGLHEIVADCAASDGNRFVDKPWVTCTCCDSCCDHETFICSDDR
eukprot:Nitzschia sp. Nitz4//scaffold53_size117307//87995//89783//NITZ4_003779-RA/size117307-snap-gene-0.117-mRNA-1//-1//CDS//3329554232//4673//frame0